MNSNLNFDTDSLPTNNIFIVLSISEDENFVVTTVGKFEEDTPAAANVVAVARGLIEVLNENPFEIFTIGINAMKREAIERTMKSMGEPIPEDHKVVEGPDIEIIVPDKNKLN